MVDKRYRVSAAQTAEEREAAGGDTFIEIEDWRADPDDADGKIEVAMKGIGRESNMQDELTVFLSVEEAAELCAVLNVILGNPRSEDLVLVNGPDALH